MAKVITFYALCEWDGGERHIPRKYIFSKEDAEKWDKEQDYKGTITKHEYIVYDDLEDLENNSKKKIKERALEKLTDEEKIVLGLK